MQALYIVAAFVVAVPVVALMSIGVAKIREDIARRDHGYVPVRRPRGGRRFLGRGALDDVVNPDNVFPGATVHNADGSQITDRAIINELMAGPVAGYGENAPMIPTEVRRQYVGPNSVTERSADGKVVPFEKPKPRAREFAACAPTGSTIRSRSDAFAPNSIDSLSGYHGTGLDHFGGPSSHRSTPAYNSPSNLPRLTGPKKTAEAPAKPKRRMPANWHMAADNGKVPDYRRDRRSFAAYGKLEVVS